MRKNAGMNFAFEEIIIHANFAFKIKKHKPTQLAHNPEDIQKFVDVLDA
tara:strand:- start:1194 stop:1340 length:147 start_codon:yes stop_codon:yes gene_type:complete